jgi:hypothetical protein
LVSGIPTFVDLAASDPGAAAAAWSGYAGFQAAAGAVDALFLGLSTLAAGSAIISQRGWPVLLGCHSTAEGTRSQRWNSVTWSSSTVTLT